jgi:hypothetical protein
MVPILLARSVVEAVARVVGPNSAACKALADADAHGGPVRFWRVGSTLIVEREGR